MITNLQDARDVKLTLKSADGKTLSSRTEKAGAGKNRFVFPIKDLPNGNYLVEVEGLGSAPLLKYPYQAAAVQIDMDRLCLLVDGKPYYVFAPLVIPRNTVPKTEKEMIAPMEKFEATVQYLADAGMKTIAIHLKAEDESGDNSAYLKRMLDFCQEKGIKMIAWITNSKTLWKGKAYLPLLESVQDHPALLTWMLFDEPELGIKEEDVAWAHEEFKKDKAPYRPLLINHTVVGIPSRYAGLNVDIISHDDYITNKVDRSVEGILDGVTILTDVAKEMRKPALFFMTGANFQNHYRETTAGELVAQTYGSVIDGVAGTWYFFGIPVGKKAWDVYQQTNAEMLALTDVIFSAEEVAEIASEQNAVMAATRKHEGKTYLITTNIEDNPVTGKLRLPEGVKEVEVLFEDRKVEVKDGVLQDKYEPYSRHVYVFENAK
ncbi:MAG: hypothetical protein ACK5NG_08635 [Chthoniobacterales bacterium]